MSESTKLPIFDYYRSELLAAIRNKKTSSKEFILIANQATKAIKFPYDNPEDYVHIKNKNEYLSNVLMSCFDHDRLDLADALIQNGFSVDFAMRYTKKDIFHMDEKNIPFILNNTTNINSYADIKNFRSAADYSLDKKEFGSFLLRMLDMKLKYKTEDAPFVNEDIAEIIRMYHANNNALNSFKQCIPSTRNRSGI